MTHHHCVQAIIALAEDSIWYPDEIRPNKQQVRLKPYVHQLPLNRAPKALQIPYTFLKIRWDASTGTYKFDAGHRFDPDDANPRALTSQFNSIIDDLNNTLFRDQLGKVRNSRQPYSNRLSDPAKENLEEHYESFYHCLSAPRTELAKINDIGETRIEALLTPEETVGGNNPKWASYTYCPKCTESFWSAFPLTTSDHENSEECPSLQAVASITYCPNCTFNQFSPAYLGSPVRFTDEEILSNASATASNTSSFSEVTLHSFQ